MSSQRDRKSTRLNSSHLGISYAVFCLKKIKVQIESARGYWTGHFQSVLEGRVSRSFEGRRPTPSLPPFSPPIQTSFLLFIFFFEASPPPSFSLFSPTPRLPM